MAGERALEGVGGNGTFAAARADDADGIGV